MRERYTITVEIRGEILYVGLLDDEQLIEYQRYTVSEQSLLQKIVMGLLTEPAGGNSYFVNIKEDKPGYIQFDVQEKIKCGTLLPVQIQREGVGRKGHLLTQKYSLPGRCLVLTPYDVRVSVSGRIENPADRERLRIIGEKLPYQDAVGYILRTDAVQHSEEQIVREAEELFALYTNIQKRSETSALGTILYQPPTPVVQYINSLPSGSVKKIVVDDAGYCKELRSQLEGVEPSLVEKVELHDQGRWDIRSFYHMTTPLERALKKEVPLRDGGSVIIEETEAMVVIDVNSGGADVRSDREETVYQINCAAAKEITRQIRLRNLAGIIIIDFIDMKNKAHQSALFNLMKQEVKKDPRKTQVHDITKLGLMELTRQRGLLPLSKVMK